MGWQTDTVKGQEDADCGRTGGRAATSWSEDDDTDSNSAVTDCSGRSDSQCLVDRWPKAVLLSAGLAVGKRDRTEVGTFGSLQRPRAPLMQVSIPFTFLNQHLSNAFAAGTRCAEAEAAGLALGFGRLLPPWPPPDLRLRFCPPLGDGAGGGAEALSGGPVGRG